MYGRDGEGWRRQRARPVPLLCPRKDGGSSANPPSPRGAGAGAADCTIPRDGARLLMFRPERCQPSPARVLPLVYFSTSSCHPLFSFFSIV